MARTKTGPTVPWPSLDQCTPLGVLLVEWMWAQKPPTPVALLASRLGVERSTLYNWLTTERKPQPMQLLVLSQVTGLPVLSLARNTEVPAERVLRQRDMLWDYVEWELRRTHFSQPNEEFDAFLAQLRAEREVALSGLRTEGEPS
jgi:transcriptional regulator with XRE-family HTH domain